MSAARPDWERVVAAHQRKLDAAGSCFCGEWPTHPNDVAWTSHLAAALDAAYVAHLGAEETREVVAAAIYEATYDVGIDDGVTLDQGRGIASAALATLTDDERTGA